MYHLFGKRKIFLGTPETFLIRRKSHVIPFLSINDLKKGNGLAVFFWYNQKRVVSEWVSANTPKMLGVVSVHCSTRRNTRQPNITHSYSSRVLNILNDFYSPLTCA